MTDRRSLPRTVVVGGVNVDVVNRVDAFPRPGETVISASHETYLGGKGANQAVAAARLGAPTALIAAVGDDPAGQQALRELDAAGVQTSQVSTLPGRTGVAYITLDTAGENSIIVAPGVNDAPGRHLSQADTIAIRTADVLLCQLEVELRLIERAIDDAQGFVAINAAPARHLDPRVLRRADLIIVNEPEWAALPELGSCQRVVITEGERGARLLENGRTVEKVPAVLSTVVSTVGAGDAFSAAATLGFASGLSAADALTAASRVGADAVRSDRSQPPLEHLSSYSVTSSPSPQPRGTSA